MAVLALEAMKLSNHLPRSRLGTLALSAWFAFLVIVGAGLMARHVISLPTPSADGVAPGLGLLRTRSETGRWLAVHVLDAACRCSQRVADHLAHTARPVDWIEMVLWVGSDPPDSELSKRFDVRRVSADQLAALGIEAAPTIVVVDPEDHVRYTGGYSSRKQGPVIEDLRILESARSGHPMASLPVFGCAVSNRLKQELSTLPGTVSAP